MMIVDASVLIGYLDASDVHHQAAEALLAESEHDLGANVVTLAEVFVGPARLGRAAEAETILRDIGIDALTFPPDTPRRLAELRAGTSLKFPDCCVILAAQGDGNTEPAAVATFDERLARAATSLSLLVTPEP